MSPTEYLDLERKAEGKSEYFRGEMFAMPGNGRWHGLIVTNLVAELRQQLKARPCDVYSTVLNPILIVEVLSDSTSDYDRGQKFQYYRALPSLREYLTGAQDVPHIEYRTRQPDDRWLLSDFRDLSQSIQLTSVDCVLSLAEVYDKVKWDA